MNFNKKRLKANIGSVAFEIDAEAYEMLAEYLDDIDSRCQDSSDRMGTMHDIEMRIAHIFKEHIVPTQEVVTVWLVRKAMTAIGNPEDFGKRRREPGSRSAKKFHRLIRPRDERVIGGVCGGIARYFELDVSLVRVLTFLLIFFGGISIWAYVILWIVIPEERRIMQ